MLFRSNFYPNCTIFLITSPSNYSANIDIKNNLYDPTMVEIVPPTLSVLDAASFVKSMDLLISPDTSLVHFACAYKVPLVAVYTKEKFLFKQWQPISSNKFLVLFSKHSKNLEGYSERDLLKNIVYMLKTLNKKSA